MKFICDVHISFKIVKLLQTLGFKAIHVNQLPKKWNTPDKEISDFANKNGYIVISKDTDFRHSYFLNKSPNKLISLGVGNMPNKILESTLTFHLNNLLQDLQVLDSFLLEILDETESILHTISD